MTKTNSLNRSATITRPSRQGYNKNTKDLSMINFKQTGDTLKPYWTNGGEISAKDWLKISAGVKRHFAPPKQLAVIDNLSPQERYLTDYLYTKVRANFNFLIPKPIPAKEYQEMHRLHVIDGRDYNTIALIINWSQQDSFWNQNIRSVAKLRKQFDALLIRAMTDARTQQNKVVSV